MPIGWYGVLAAFPLIGLIMSLKFGIYLVEQRIVTPEQFCGLVKIQQESTRSLASLSISHNYLTIKQVSRVLDGVSQDESKFIDYALSKNLLERSDASHLMKLQEQGGESIRSLAVEFNHFQRYGSRAIQMKRRPVASKPAAPKKPAVPAPAKPRPIIQPSVTPTPKFKQRPIIKVEESQH